MILRRDLMSRGLCARCADAGIGRARLDAASVVIALVDERRPAAGNAPRQLARIAARAPSSRAALPSACVGKPTTSSAGLPFANQRLRSRQAARRRGPAAIVASGCASACVVSPTATPMRRVPKSNASMVPARQQAAARSPPSSRVPDGVGQPRKIDSEQLHRRRQRAFRPAGRTSRRARASTVSQAFCAISCSSWPADQPAVAQRYQHIRAGRRRDPTASRMSFDVVKAQVVADRQRRLPAAERPVQHEPAVDLHRTAVMHRRARADRNRRAAPGSARTASDSVMSIGLLITMPSAPFSLCSQT